EKDKLLDTMAKEHPEIKDKLNKVEEKTKEIKEETDKNIKELESTRDTKTDGLNGEIQTLKTELAQAEQKEKTDKVLKENMTGDQAAAIEFAKQFEGMSEDEMRKVFKEKGYQFDSGAWCADFVRMALGEGVGLDNLPDWYKNSSNPAYCPTLYSEASAAGAVIDISQAKPGDMVLFDWDGDNNSDHVGILVDSGDGYNIKTIEGNTSGSSSSCVAYKDRDMSTIRAIVSMG
ncbi:MAG: CHAP domain-containing protein, partial [Candidatus Gastranaerophilales bacterium]|nr:CHAP domain-containing protein [Candidatus Gastranaerophilales bacterium]